MGGTGLQESAMAAWEKGEIFPPKTTLSPKGIQVPRSLNCLPGPYSNPYPNPNPTSHPYPNPNPDPNPDPDPNPN